MKFQFLILLALVGFGASQNQQASALVIKCFKTRFESTRFLGFSEAVLHEARGVLWNPRGCGTPDECFSGILRKIKMSSSPDASKLVAYLDKEFKWCYPMLKRTIVVPD
ncbi:unnamed protein product [Caenorhabditis nigoni]